MRELLSKALAELDNADSFGVPGLKPLIDEIQDELAKPEPEPVVRLAWFRKYERDTAELVISDASQGDSFPVYTHPPAQQKPLSDDEIMNFYNESAANPKNAWKIKSVIIETARRLEQAHGIK